MTFRKFGFAAIIFISGLCFAEEDFDKAEIFFDNPGLKTNTSKLIIELAVTQKQKEQGFMERKNIPEGTGMVFVYKTDKNLTFWMKNTPKPLSIAFIDASGMITEICDMEPYSLDLIKSSFPVRYALEVPQGMFTRMGIRTGSTLTASSLQMLKRYSKP